MDEVAGHMACSAIPCVPSFSPISYSHTRIRMRHRSTSNRRILGLCALALAATVAACTDTSGLKETDVAHGDPGYLTSSASVNQLVTLKLNLLYPALATQLPLASVRGDTVVQRFTVNPNTGSIVILGLVTQHVIAIPGNALCNPSTSTYGPSEWLKPCALATEHQGDRLRILA